MKGCFQKPGISNAFSGTKCTKGAGETLSCSLLLLPSFEQAENKAQFLWISPRVACAHPREGGSQPSTSVSHNSSMCSARAWRLPLGNSGIGLQESSLTLKKTSMNRLRGAGGNPTLFVQVSLWVSFLQWDTNNT